MSQSVLGSTIAVIGRRWLADAPLKRVDTAAPDWRSQGDAARDRRAWAEAASCYERHLAAVPGDAAIWIQLGHAYKESGRLDAAETAYRTALDITPDDADLLLQIAHLMKLMGRTTDAVQGYAASLRRVPSIAAHQELTGLGRGKLANSLLQGHGAQGRAGETFLQINDLFFYLRHHKTVSGIQRVQVGIINHILQAGVAGHACTFVFSNLRDTKLWSVPRNELAAIITHLAEPEVEHDTLRRMIDAATSQAVPVTPRPGDSFILLGAFWGIGGSTDLLRDLREKQVHLGLYFYDLIPVTHPEYCDERLTVDFTQALFGALSFVDFGLAISDYTARELRRFASENGFPELPIETVPLAHTIRDLAPEHEAAADPAGDWPATIADLRGRPFVLCVCTIEARKNHRYLFDAWKMLIEEGIDPPDLVFVGRQGWRVDDLCAQLEATGYLGGRIRVVHDLSDEELATLYRNCRFTVFPSVVEGWGLPIGESLSYGKVCVASSTSSMPEVGGDLVEYIDPLNLRAGLDVLRALIVDPRRLAEREAMIASRFKPRGWAEVGRDFLEAVGRLRASVEAAPRPAFVPRLLSGRILAPTGFTTGTRRSRQGAEGYRQLLALTRSWYAPEAFGSWIAGRHGRVQVESDLGPDREVVVFMLLASTQWATSHQVTLTGQSRAGQDKLKVSAAVPPGQRFLLRGRTRTDAQGCIVLDLSVSGPLVAQEGDSRLLSVGLVAFAYAATEDAVSRAEVLEHMLIDQAGPMAS